MTWPTTFGTLLGGDEPLSLFDGMFNQTAAMIQIPCSASGNNAVSLTPLINCPALTAYNELGGYRFRANGNSSGAVTAQFNGLGFLPVYHADGVTQANVGDLVNGQEYVLIYSATLAGGFPGFFLEQPAIGGGSVGLGGTPGGRLTLTLNTPVMTANQAGTGTIYYAPYTSQFVPIWNGSTLQQYNFCSSLSDQTGLLINMLGSANWPINNAFDVFVTLNSGVPILATVQWTQPGPSPPPSRATALSIFGGMLTNATTATMRINSTTTISVPANQGTFVGTVYTSPTDGESQWIYGGAASGGTAASFGLCNYYNKVLFNTVVEDNGAIYTYTTATARQARASGGNQISYIQSDSERAANFSYLADGTTTANSGAGMIVGVGIASNAFNVYSEITNSGAAASNIALNTPFSISSTGLRIIFAIEQGDGSFANTFDRSSANQLFGAIWL
jgi:hypothetical protein